MLNHSDVINAESETERRIPDPETRPLLKVSEVAKITGFSEENVYALVKSGELKSIRNGRHIYVTTTGLRAFLQLP